MCGVFFLLLLKVFHRVEVLTSNKEVEVKRSKKKYGTSGEILIKFLVNEFLGVDLRCAR